MQFQHAEAPGLEQPEALGEEVDVALATAPVRNEQKLGRNELCYCGSGKKFKHCHGQISNPVSNAEIPAPRPAPAVAAFCHYTTALPKRCTSSIRSAFMAVGLGPLPTLHPVAGFELGIASAGIKRPGRKDVVVMRCAEGSTVAGVFTLNAFAPRR
jgi:hypothetical protein